MDEIFKEGFPWEGESVQILFIQETDFNGKTFYNDILDALKSKFKVSRILPSEVGKPRIVLLKGK